MEAGTAGQPSLVKGLGEGHCKNSHGADCRREEKLIVDRYMGRNSVSIQVAWMRERMLES